MSRPAIKPQARSLWALRVGVAAALVVSAVVHVQPAPGYQQAVPGGLGQGTLFLIEAVASVVAAVFVLLKGSRTAFAAAAVVAFSSPAGVILYRYVQVPALGPLPKVSAISASGFAPLERCTSTNATGSSTVGRKASQTASPAVTATATAPAISHAFPDAVRLDLAGAGAVTAGTPFGALHFGPT